MKKTSVWFDGWGALQGHFPEQRKEALDPTIDGAPINNEAALGEPFDTIGVTQAVADVPADR
jgi:hypothetical protein